MQTLTASPTSIGADANPYTAIGLNGNGEVAAIADTGLDQLSCYFADPVNGQIAASQLPGPITTNLNMRKVVQYTYVKGAGDGYDCVDGHGTLTR